MKKLAYLYLLTFLLMVFPSQVYSQSRCTNKLLTEIAEQLSEISSTNDFVDEMIISSISKSKPIVFHRNSEGIIDHIGIKFFHREVIQKHPSPIYYFIERYFLELLLLPTQEEVNTKLRMERVSISSEMFSMIDVKNGLRDIVSAVSDDLSIYITCTNNRCAASCIKDNKVIARIHFPIRYELITGYTKLEAENSIYLALLNFKPNDFQFLPESSMSAFKEGIYSANDDFHVAEYIISTSYYRKKEDLYVPVYDSSLPELSVYNLFNTSYDWNVEACVEQNMYGGKKMTYCVPLVQLTTFLKSQGCNLYTGIQNIDKNQISGVLMAVNMELGYQHIMRFSMNTDVLTMPKQNSVKIKMYSYVPIHNVSSLM